MFRVMILSEQNYYTKKDEIVTFLVTDKPQNYIGHIEKWPTAAEFRVSIRHDEETQKRRAVEYCEYLNRGIVVQLPIGT